MESIIDVGLYISYALIAVCALAAIAMPLLQSFSDPKTLIKSAVGVVALIVIFIISYAIADPDAAGATESTSKLVGAGIITMYILFAIAVVGILYTELGKIFK